MTDDIYRKVATSAPVNATAGRVMSGGFHFESQRKEGDILHWRTPQPMKPHPKDVSFKDMTGKKFGRFTVIGYLGKNGTKKATGRWLVKCACGDYEARSGRAIENPNNAEDMCVECRHLQHIKTKRGRGKGTTLWGQGNV